MRHLKPSDLQISQEGTISVPGTVSYSGKTATFKPTADLKSDTRYTATIKSNLKSTSEDGEHSWTFTTGKGRKGDGNSNALSIVSVLPLKDATAVAVAIQPIVTFKDDMSSSKIKAMKITLTEGTTAVVGSLAYSGKTAKFIPASSLKANTVYTVTVSSVAKSDDDDHEGDDNKQSSKTYSWSFTTGGGGVDVTAPTVQSVVPGNNATSIVAGSNVSATFSEAMNASTINTSTFTANSIY